MATSLTPPLLSRPPPSPRRFFRCFVHSSSSFPSFYPRHTSRFPSSLTARPFLNDRYRHQLSVSISLLRKGFPAQTYSLFQALPRPARCLPVTAEAGAKSQAEKEEKEGYEFLRNCRNAPKDTNVLVVGSTGYIGKYVVAEIVKRGYNVIAIARDASGIGGKSDRHQTMADLKGATVCFADVTDLSSLKRALQEQACRIDVVVCCLASRSGGVKDSWRIDYQASKNSLEAGLGLGASHFVLLSAICVQKPLLGFQKAKLKLEAELQACGDRLTWSIVRPTAFFKSLGAQVESLKAGFPYIMFGDGRLSACKPISEPDLASFIADCIHDQDKLNKILPVGGPGPAYTPLQQGELLFKILGKPPKFIKLPIEIMDFAIGVLDLLARTFSSLEDAAEFGKIGRYYAAESMLVLDPETQKYDAEATPSYGSDTLEDFFERVVRDGMAGQELGDQAVF